MPTQAQVRQFSQPLPTSSPLVLRPGSPIRVRHRPACIEHIRRHGPRRGASHLVSIRYIDGLLPEREELLWEVEAPFQAACSFEPHPGNRIPFEAFLAGGLALQRNNLIPFPGFPGIRQELGPSGTPWDLAPPIAPSQALLAPDPHQLVPLEKVLEKRRVRLLLADEPGLGKTFQAALVVHELLMRRRASRILILCPPGLRKNWQSEMRRFVDLEFDLLDNDSCRRNRQATAVWNQTDRAIASYYWLRQPEVLKGFLTAQERSGPAGPWDLLVVDEAHHLVPPGGSASLLHDAMCQLVGWFPHRVFLTATPHSGFTSSLTGLLQLLDPLRFERTESPSLAMRRAMKDVVVRRTRESLTSGPSSMPAARCVTLSAPATRKERELWLAWDRAHRSITAWTRGDSECGSRWTLGLQVLQKRLLSSLPAFAASFLALANSIPSAEAASASTAIGLEEVARDSTSEPLDAIERWDESVGLLARLAGEQGLPLTERLEAVRNALTMLELSSAQRQGSRIQTFCDWAWPRLQRGSSEKLLVFSEFADTVKAVVFALVQAGASTDQVAGLDSGISISRREELLRRFADPKDSLSLLVTTDLASEGLNLHHACRCVVHLDLPWNPGKLAQRTGRVLRRGQDRPVFNLLLTSDTDAEKAFLKRLRAKSLSVLTDVGGSPQENFVKTGADPAAPTTPFLPTLEPAQATNPSLLEPSVCRDVVPARGLAWADAWNRILGPPTLSAPLLPGSWCVARLPGWEGQSDHSALLALARWLALDVSDAWLMRWALPLWFGVRGTPANPQLGPPALLNTGSLLRLAGSNSRASAASIQPRVNLPEAIHPDLLNQLEVALGKLQAIGREALPALLNAQARTLVKEEHAQAAELVREIGNSSLARTAARRAKELQLREVHQTTRGWLFSKDRMEMQHQLHEAESRWLQRSEQVARLQACSWLDPAQSSVARRLVAARTSLAAPPSLILEAVALLFPAGQEVGR